MAEGESFSLDAIFGSEKKETPPAAPTPDLVPAAPIPEAAPAAVQTATIPQAAPDPVPSPPVAPAPEPVQAASVQQAETAPVPQPAPPVTQPVPVVSPVTQPAEVVSPAQPTSMVQPMKTKPDLPEPKEIAPGVMQAQFGVKVSRYPIDRYKAKAGVADRISILSIDILVVKTHFEDGIGYFYCFGGECCQINGLPNIRYVVPAVQYDTNKEGAIISPKFDVKYLMLGGDAYDAFITQMAHIDLLNTDFLITCADEQYQKNTYQNIGQATWRTHEQFAALVMKQFQEVWPFAKIAVGRSFTREQYLERTNAQTMPVGTDQAGGQFDLNSFMNTDG